MDRFILSPFLHGSPSRDVNLDFPARVLIPMEDRMAKFSKAHYVVIRDAIIKARLSSCDNPMQHPATVIIDRVALEIGCVLKKDNRAFNLEQFLSEIRGYRSPR